MRRYWSLFWQYFVQYAKVRLAYRGDFLISVATMTMATVFGIAVVFLIFRKVPNLKGWNFYEILFLYGFSLLPMALFNTISINLYYFGENYIVQGKFDRVLLRPVHSLFQIISEQFRLEALGDAVLGVFVIVVCGAHLGLRLGVLEWLYIVVASLLGCSIYTSVFLILTAVSFYFEDRVGVMPPVYNMIAFSRYPLDIYNGFIKAVLSWVVPFAFAAFYPTAALLGHDTYRIYAWLLPLVAVVFFLLSLAIWNRGVRNYASTGS